MGSLAPTQIMRPWPLTCNPFGVCWCNGEFPSCVVMVCHACTSCLGALGIEFKKLLLLVNAGLNYCRMSALISPLWCQMFAYTIFMVLVSTNNNTWSTYVHISKNCLLVFKLIDCLELCKWLIKLSLILEVFQFKVHSLMTRRIEI